VIEGEIRRTDCELVRVSTVEYGAFKLVELSLWRVRRDRGTWFRVRAFRVGVDECADLAAALLIGARRARR